jgi:phage tail sheath protein FI
MQTKEVIMPVSLTYPGVYIEEIPSGVRTITGVSTSVTAFAGSARRGPVNKATRVLNYSDYERRFGGLSSDSEMSYAVRQFFLNGGSEAWIVRLAYNPNAASRQLSNDTDPVLTVTALDEGLSANNIEVRVAYKNDNPASFFNLTLNYISADNSSDNKSESFSNLSMNSKSNRYFETVINDVSQLVSVKTLATPAMLAALGKGESKSGELTAGGALFDVSTKIDATHDQFQVSVNGSATVTVQVAPGDISAGTNLVKLNSLCSAIQTRVLANASANPFLAGFTCTSSGGNKILMKSGVAGETSSVEVLPGARNDLSARLLLGTLNGGTETEAAAELCPLEMPDHGTLTSGTFAAGDLTTLPDTSHTSFQIGLDGYGPDSVTLTDVAAAGAALKDRLEDVAARVQSSVRAIKPSNAAYRDFTVALNATDNGLVFSSGTRGYGSKVVVNEAAANGIAAELNLLSGATGTQPQNAMLSGGTEAAITDATAYGSYIGNRSTRKGIYALEAVDLFNLLCLPGVTDAGILMDAVSYCVERRAFMIIDAPRSITTPDQMVTSISGTSLPKSEYAAVYYPWIKAADPLNGGKLRIMPPCGTIAGLYARTDSARGVWKAPAGIEATLTGVQSVTYTLTNSENGTLNPLGVNCIRVLPVYGSLAWGARTLRGADSMTSEYKYVPIRRVALYIEESLYRGTQWVVFEPNDEPLWSQIRLNLGSFMHGLFRQGAFQGTTPREAYFVKCDKETTTQYDINKGIVNILVGFAPLKPAEFVIIKIQQIAGQIQV